MQNVSLSPDKKMKADLQDFIINENTNFNFYCHLLRTFPMRLYTTTQKEEEKKQKFFN